MPRDVDGEFERAALCVPRGHLRARFLQDPGADFSNLAGALENGDELVGFEDSTRRVLPAQQRLDANHGEIREGIEGLIDEVELAFRESGAKFVFEGDALADLFFHLWIEEDVLVLSVRLGL